VTMENQTVVVRRPIGLWVIVGVYSTLILLSYAIQFYMRFRSSYSEALEARYADWTLLDHVFSYYPGILILLGCLGLVMMKRWAVYVFGVLLALRLRELAVALVRDISPDAAFLVWVTHAFSLLTAAVAFLYALHLWRKGILRTGAY
jgi:hypothetical protein